MAAQESDMAAGVFIGVIFTSLIGVLTVLGTNTCTENKAQVRAAECVHFVQKHNDTPTAALTPEEVTKLSQCLAIEGVRTK